MYNIVKEDSGEVPQLFIEHPSPSEHNHRSKVVFPVCCNNKGVSSHFCVFESHSKSRHTNCFKYIHKNNYVEWSPVFAPDLPPDYFNFEVNSIGATNVSFRKNLSDDVTVFTGEYIESPDIQMQAYDDCRTVDCPVPYILICKHVPRYQISAGTAALENVCKCGGLAGSPHSGCRNMTCRGECNAYCA